MRHPNEATLALHAGGDLGAIARWKVERHLAQCESCRQELAAFHATREIVTDLGELPDLPWNSLAAEMKANIRLGLSAGECVRTGPAPLRDHPWFQGMRTAVAFASVLILVVTGLFLERPQPHPASQAKGNTGAGMVMGSTANGIQMTDGGQSLSLMNSGAENVIYSVDGPSVGARYIDPNTGAITVNTLYAP